MESGATIPDQSGRKGTAYLFFNRPVWYEVRAYLLQDWSGKKVALLTSSSLSSVFTIYLILE